MSKLNVISEESPWYAQGLKFQCTQCGKCCTGSPGYTWLSEQDVVTIAKYLQLSIEEFALKYLRLVNGKFALTEKPLSFDCVFLKDKKCQIYPVRPTQCRTFPWWQRNLKSREDWQNAAKYCEGISEEAPLISCETIQSELDKQDHSVVPL